MQTARDGIAVVDGRVALQSDDALVEVWTARCAADAQGRYVSGDPRLFVVLDPLDAVMELESGDAPGVQSRAPSTSFVPAGAPLTMRTRGETAVRHLDLHVSADHLARLLGPGGPRADEPKLLVADLRVQRLARLVDAPGDVEANDPGRGPGLFCDAWLAAMVTASVSPVDATADRRSALSDRQLKLAVDHIEDRFAEPIRLQELAALTGLSESYFSHAFKAATGMPPHRWQLRARLARAEKMLLDPRMSLAAIASATGFSDQSHFTRTFKLLTGMTPSAWRSAAATEPARQD